MAARCLGVLSKIATMETMNVFLEKVLPWLGAIDDTTKQEGAIEAMACILPCAPCSQSEQIEDFLRFLMLVVRLPVVWQCQTYLKDTDGA